jgi:transglutaminase-like putative cysteine protease
MTVQALGIGPVMAEPLHVRGARAGLYGLSLALYLLPFATWSGILAAILAALGGIRLASTARRRGLRLTSVLVLGPPAILLALGLGEVLTDARWFSSLLGVRAALVVAEAVSFALAGFLVAFLLRFLAHVSRSLSVVEVLFVAGSVATLLADHRNRMLNRPRFFSDWAWSLGVNPTTVLVAIGIAGTLLAILLFLRNQRLLKLVTTLLLVALLGAAFYVLWDKRIESATPPDPLGLAGKGKGKSGGGGGGEGGSSSNPFKDSYQSSSPPSPVAIAVLRDDFEPTGDLLYFRQTALSFYNGHHLVGGIDRGWDRDVITRFPTRDALDAERTQSPENHIDVPTTMYLLVDHPQPVALTHADRIRMVQNPNPQQFVAAYDVRSKVLSVQPHRLVGRRSIPASWSAKQRAHYTALPDDPRYRALADIVARDVDPRFAEDDLAKAFAIKRHLEREGFYTMKSKHASKDDPVASFLFGSLRGYCVHFAHAAVYLLRSQGIAARVVLGYAVQINKRSGGSAILIMSDRAHAWPEIHLEGIGWVTFDIYPERTDMPPPVPVDYDLEKLLGELARNDPTAGVSPDRRPLKIPWRLVLGSTALLLATLLACAFVVKIARRLAPRLGGRRAYPRRAYVAVLDLLSDLGVSRRVGETRERHAARVRPLAPHMETLTRAHLALALGGRSVPDHDAFARLVTQVREDVRTHVPWHRRALALLNPFGWLRTR